MFEIIKNFYFSNPGMFPLTLMIIIGLFYLWIWWLTKS